MKTRAITAFFFTIVMLGSIFLGGYAFTGFYLLLSVVSLLEFYKMIKVGGIRPHRNIAVIVATSMFLLTASYHFFQFELKYLLLIIPLIFSIFIVELYKKEKIPFANISYTFVGFIYVTIPFCFFYSLGFLTDFRTYDFHLPLSFLFFLWASDTGA
jgi:phosphatidate cytidylyltransferase